MDELHQSGEVLEMGTLEQVVFEKASLAADEDKLCSQELPEGCGGWDNCMVLVYAVTNSSRDMFWCEGS